MDNENKDNLSEYKQELDGDFYKNCEQVEKLRLFMKTLA